MVIRKKRISFWAKRPVKVPKKVSFRTRDGRKVSFKAKKTVNRRKKVNFYARK